MAAGRTHDIINLSLLPVAVYYLQPESFSGFVGGYLVGTFFLSPDNDIYHSKPNRRWKLLRFIWLPYTKIFSHRGVSHLPVVGSVLKILYLLILFLLLLSILAGVLYFSKPDLLNSIDIPQQQLMFYIKHPFTVSFLIGLILSEIVHIITDMIYSTAKKFKLIR
ncbi:Uncharacterized metal-binding protein [Persephonella hydrogeniphila]|uniref:Uncharacterized metal-binding protein n=1 Tax=Persephonella hydrogeniphila TaxID=198703 RepID=A0A285NCJ5_9AQUI|nr:metal-binding protein [Persephonella hydrogeniphila]SNZ07170.1 Uncharacterized metal-binding protein [Persephonella hydrogeniphila]